MMIVNTTGTVIVLSLLLWLTVRMWSAEIGTALGRLSIWTVRRGWLSKATVKRLWKIDD